MRSKAVVVGMIVVAQVFVLCPVSWAEISPKKSSSNSLWRITAYCSCVKCCLKSDGITASGKKATPDHTIALNWLPFGTKVNIAGKLYFVEDRGAESLFGTYYHRKGPKNQIKHIDIYFESHNSAKSFGNHYTSSVEILK